MTGEVETGPLRLEFDRSIKLAFCGSSISSDGGLLLHWELDDTFGLTDLAEALNGDPRTGKNGRHRLAGFLSQSAISRLAGCEDVNDAFDTQEGASGSIQRTREWKVEGSKGIFSAMQGSNIQWCRQKRRQEILEVVAPEPVASATAGRVENAGSKFRQ